MPIRRIVTDKRWKMMTLAFQILPEARNTEGGHP